MAITLRSIHTKYRIPDGVLLGYPSLTVSPKKFVPSSLIALDEFVLNSHIEETLHQLNLTRCDPNTEVYASPLLAKDEDLEQFPPVRMVIAGRDPLRDPNYLLLHRFISLGVDVYLKEFSQLPHGFWGFLMTSKFPECKFTISDTAAWLKELIAIHHHKLQQA